MWNIAEQVLGMRRLWVGAVLFLIAGCGNNRQWPATIVSTQGFSPTQLQALQSAIGSLNSQSKRILITSSGGPKSFPISISLVGPDQATENRAGCATVDSNQCSVQLSTLLFESDYAGDLESVVWHELGHCAGLVHVPQSGEIMYAYTNSFSSYSSGALSRFFASIIGSSGL